VVKQKRKLDGALMFCFILALWLLTAITVAQQLQIKELAKQQTVILVIVDEKLDPIEEKYSVIADIVDNLVGGDDRVVYGVGDGN